MIDLLVVEPSISVRKALERVLEAGGYTMRGVTRAADALEQVSRQRPDLILCEVTLPDGDGLELCSRFSLAGLPVLLLSGRVDDQLRHDGQQAGALGVLGKPISPEDLLECLAYHLKLPGAARPPRLNVPPTLLGGLMTRPGVLGAALLCPGGRELEQVGRPIPAALYHSLLAPRAADVPDPDGVFSVDSGRAPAPPELQCAQLEYPDHCLLLLRLPGPPVCTVVCLIQNSSYASLIRYHLRSSPYVRL